MRRGRNAEHEDKNIETAYWGPPWASWVPLGLLGSPVGCRTVGLARLTPSEAVLGASLGPLVGRFR
eukprot:3457252-Pyramimonas_sp.AAC.1